MLFALMDGIGELLAVIDCVPLVENVALKSAQTWSEMDVQGTRGCRSCSLIAEPRLSQC
jgi:hypothetical protein